MESTFYIFALLLSIHNCVFGQVCEETRSVFREVPETFRFSFIETYEEPCFIFCSVKTRKSVNVTTRMVQRYDDVTVSVCCDGYVEDTDHEGSGLYCEPTCDPPCENGYCKKPNECACDPGFALDPLSSHVCKPLCLEGCHIPNCITTKTPQCSSNTSLEISTRPFCPEPCINGVCIQPGFCQCLPGYSSTSPNTCEADWPSNYSCEHGSFVKPNTCLCDLGYEWKCGNCEPVCNECEHGTCVSPGECSCDDGYVSNGAGKCEPQCSSGCANGRCIIPEVCSCDPGWYKATEDGECQPHCDMNCNHGDCIAPNICDCHTGYQLYINSKGRSRCLINRKNCTDLGSDPETCQCHPPYQISYFRDDGIHCFCVGACADESTRCTKATCLFMDVPPDPNAEIDYDYLIDSDEEDYDEASESTSEQSLNDVDDVLTTEDPKQHNYNMLMTLLPTFGTGDTTEFSRDTQTAFSSLNKEVVNEQINNEKMVPKIENVRKKRETAKIPFHWITGSVVVAAIIVLVILAIIAKRRCCRTRPLNSKDIYSVNNSF